jgi:ubiquinone/menaquinone biosynthesis C-methylase UbiE
MPELAAANPAYASAVDREREFYDSQRSERGAAAVARALIKRSIGEFNTFGEFLDGIDARDRVALDYGCGRGYVAVRLAQGGARSVTGIDVSAAELEFARLHAAEGGVEDRISFVVGDAQRTPFPDKSFDLIVGVAILHHLEFEKALLEVRRLLRPGGEAVFFEPLRHNPILRVGRALTPGARTDDEHPLTDDDWALCSEVCDDFSHFEREFVTVPLMPLNLVLPRRAQKALARQALRLDARVLARFPRLRKYARVTVLRFTRAS